VPGALEAANADLAATIVHKALLQRVLMTVERTFAVNPRPSDRHARVAFEHPYLMRWRRLDRERSFSRRALTGADTMQTPDANDLSTIAIRSWHMRVSEIRRYRCPSSLS
jgi:hypothetical protein